MSSTRMSDARTRLAPLPSAALAGACDAGAVGGGAAAAAARRVDRRPAGFPSGGAAGAATGVAAALCGATTCDCVASHSASNTSLPVRRMPALTSSTCTRAQSKGADGRRRGERASGARALVCSARVGVPASCARRRARRRWRSCRCRAVRRATACSSRRDGRARPRRRSRRRRSCRRRRCRRRTTSSGPPPATTRPSSTTATRAAAAGRAAASAAIESLLTGSAPGWGSAREQRRGRHVDAS